MADGVDELANTSGTRYPASMKHASDMQHPITDEWAAQLYTLTPWSEVPETEPYREQRVFWEIAPAELRDVFRARARRMLAGDLSVEPWRLG